MVATTRTLLVLLAALAPLVLVIDYLHPRFLVFSPTTLQRLSAEAIAKHGDNIDALFLQLVADLQSTYPNVHIDDLDERKWVFNVAGGATGSMHILHASITEYLILFGSATGTEGHSGAHLAHDYFTILSGRQTAAFLGETRPRAYTPGMQHHHPRGVAAQYAMDNGTWALELAQGIIPAMLPFGLVQMPLSVDLDSLWRTVWYTGRHVVLNLLNGKV